jgi:hypothetical protein
MPKKKYYGQDVPSGDEVRETVLLPTASKSPGSADQNPRPDEPSYQPKGRKG